MGGFYNEQPWSFIVATKDNQLNSTVYWLPSGRQPVGAERSGTDAFSGEASL